MSAYTWLFALGVLLLASFLPVYSYLALIYRELGRMTTGPVHEHLDIFEGEIEPKLNINRRSAGRAFRILGHFWLAFLVLQTTRGVGIFVRGFWESVIELAAFIVLEVVIAMHFIPDILLYRTTGRWLIPLLPFVRASLVLAWPVRVFLEGAESLARISESDAEKTEEQRTEEGIEALVEAAEEEGIIEPEQAELIEQVVEFSDKRVREVMTPRPDIVAIAANATLEDLHAKFTETGFTRIPVFEETIDDIAGIAHSRDLLQVADADLPKKQVRELMRPALFMPETKVGSDLLREMRQKSQTMAVIIDEHGSVAGIATMEDLVEEIVGESGSEATHPKLEMVREGTSSLLMRGSTAIGQVEEMLGVQFGESADETVTTIAGLLSHVSGKVPAPGEKFDLEGFRFEVLEANQRKVLRVKAQKLTGTAMHAG
ncbi:MAG TPA: hemolysin family protein [Candidatus Eisenbacteria bacterium]|nr:hemolysin family protein [Candidatus Eisenbacteria bacterium]